MINCYNCRALYRINECEKYFDSKECQKCRVKNNITPSSKNKSLWSKNVVAAKLWSEKNFPLLPIDIHGGSNNKYYFYCKKCHKNISSTVANFTRLTATQQCNECAHLSRGEKNSRPRGETVNDSKYLMEIWSYEKNIDISPKDLAINSNKKVWWICERGHESFTSIANRNSGRGCGRCMEKYFISKPEKDLLDFIKSIYGGVILANKRLPNFPYESDIFLPKFSLIIDFNGTYWHSEKIIQEKKLMTSFEWHSLRVSNALKYNNTLLYVWEDDWNNDRNLVEYSLKKLLYFGEADEIFGIMSK